jgi:hypothetical protein
MALRPPKKMLGPMQPNTLRWIYTLHGNKLIINLHSVRFVIEKLRQVLL